MQKKNSSELYNIVIIQKDLFLFFFSFIKSLKVSLRSGWLTKRDVKKRYLSVYEEGKSVSSTAPNQIHIWVMGDSTSPLKSRFLWIDVPL